MMQSLEVRWLLWRAQPTRYTFRKVSSSRLLRVLAVVRQLLVFAGLALLTAALLAYSVRPAIAEATAHKVAQSYHLGRSTAAQEFADGWKIRLQSDPELIRATCVNWWFNSTVIKRK